MKKNIEAQEVKKINLVEGINNLIEEKAKKVEKSEGSEGKTFRKGN